MTKESRLSALQDLIISLNDPILESLLHSPDFKEFLLTQGPGLSALIRQSILDLFRVHSYENGGAIQQSSNPCSWQEARDVQPRQCVKSSFDNQETERFPGAPSLLDDVATAPEKTVKPPGRMSLGLSHNAHPEPELVPATALDHRSPEFVKDAIIDLIEETTGYPRDMIGLDKSLERDLRIDSIKRNEMLLVLQKKLGIPPVSDDSFWQDESVNSLAEKLLNLLNK